MSSIHNAISYAAASTIGGVIFASLAVISEPFVHFENSPNSQRHGKLTVQFKQPSGTANACQHNRTTLDPLLTGLFGSIAAPAAYSIAKHTPWPKTCTGVGVILITYATLIVTGAVEDRISSLISKTTSLISQAISGD